MAADFAGKTALITGAGRGIGREVALGLGQAGARVFLLARTTSQLEETRVLLREGGVPAARVSVLRADLSEEQDRERALTAALAAGRVDILVNNAATVEPLGPTAGVKAGDLRLAFEVNVIAPAAGCDLLRAGGRSVPSPTADGGCPRPGGSGGRGAGHRGAHPFFTSPAASNE